MPIDWTSLNDKLPTKTTEEQKEQRKSIFTSFDPNGNGFLSLAECDRGVKELTGDLFPSPVILRAFSVANGVAQEHGRRTHGPGADFVELSEFRVLFVYLKRYLLLWEIFFAVDAGDDRRISLAEFKMALPKLAEWGASVDDPDGEFNRIDTNGGGQILFVEFADWGLKKTLTHQDMDRE